MSGSSGLFISYVHVKLDKLITRTLLTNVSECPLITLDPITRDIRMIALDVHVSRVCESKFMSIPGTEMQVLIAVLVSLSTNTGLGELVRGISAYETLESI